MNHLSWERTNSSTHHNSSSFKPKSSYNSRSKREKLPIKIDLLGFGYSCKLFNDDEKAKYLDQGKNLVKWNDDNNLLIDRFDVRGYLNQTELQKYEAKINENYLDQLTEEDLKLERKLNKERFKDLYKEEGDNLVINKEELDQDEEIRKWKESIEESDKKFNQIQFNYNNLEDNYKNEENLNQQQQQQQSIQYNSNSNDDDNVEFILPVGLELPDNLKLPTTMKEHNLIEKTAKFISKQDVQMEIILKTKQSSNSQFDFLNYDSPLNEYYKHLVKSIKDGSYKPKEDKSSIQDESSEEDDEEDNYLHPSLQGSTNNNTNNYSYNLPISTKPINSLYSKLAENLKDKIVVNDKSYYEPKVIESKGIKYDLNNKNDNKLNSSSNLIKDSINNKSNEPINQQQSKIKSVFDLMPEIPNDIKIIIEKLAQYVCKNGEEFEKTVRSRNENRFDFLNPGHKFHYYYVKTKLKLIEEKNRLTKSTLIKTNTADLNVNKSSNNSIKDQSNLNNDKSTNELGGNQKVQPFMISSKRQTFKDDLEAKKLKEKQEERKKKAALFLSKLKSQKSNDDEPNDELNKIIGPLNQQNEQKEKESVRNTPSPLRLFFNDLDIKKDGDFKVDEIKLRENLNLTSNNINNSSEIEPTSFKKLTKRDHYRKQESSSDEEDKKSNSIEYKNSQRDRKRKSRSSSRSRHKHRRSRSSRYSRSRSRSPNYHHRKRSHHRSKSRERNRDRSSHHHNRRS